MRTSINTKFVAIVVIAVFVALFAAGTIVAESVVTYAEGMVVVERDGTIGVMVCDDGRDCEVLYPSNGKGLFQAGKIDDGDVVTVKIVSERGHRHRGHVTVLK